jgi:hypothetical protein
MLQETTAQEVKAIGRSQKQTQQARPARSHRRAAARARPADGTELKPKKRIQETGEGQQGKNQRNDAKTQAVAFWNFAQLNLPNMRLALAHFSTLKSLTSK